MAGTTLQIRTEIPKSTDNTTTTTTMKPNEAIEPNQSIVLQMK